MLTKRAVFCTSVGCVAAMYLATLVIDSYSPNDATESLKNTLPVFPSAGSEMYKLVYGRATPQSERKVHVTGFKYILNEENLCAKKNGSDIVLLMVVFVTIRQDLVRDYVRTTWAAVGKNNPKARLVFIVGLPKIPKQDLPTLRNESEKHHDIIQANFTDAYRNLTLKSLAIYKWINTYCSDAKFVLKIDSDMQVDAKRLLNILETKTFPDAFLCGKIYPHNIVLRSKGYKVWVSEEQYPAKYYPLYCNGPIFVVPQRIVQKIAQTPIPKEPFPVDDAFITGILREKINESAVEVIFKYYHDNRSLRLKNGHAITVVHFRKI